MKVYCWRCPECSYVLTSSKWHPEGTFRCKEDGCDLLRDWKAENVQVGKIR